MPCEIKVEEEGKCRFLLENGKDPLCKRRGEFLCRDGLDSRVPLLSHSAREMWIKCRRKYFLNRIRGVYPIQHKISAPLKFGQMWDKFLEVQYGGKHDLNQLALDLDLTELEIAKFNAITAAYKKIGFVREGSCELQKPIYLQCEPVGVKGFVDRGYDDFFVESKMSARPQYYQDPFNVAFQVGTYFISNPNWKYVVMEVTRTPTTAWDRENQTIEKYEKMLYQDIMKRSPMYFPGMKRKENTYGKIFFRSEFPLEDIMRTYSRIGEEIVEASKYSDESHFYQSFNCEYPFPCEYKTICRDGVISESLFRMRDKEEEDIDE